MIIVTGGAGFIGSNLVRALNERGREDIIVVDNLTHGAKFHNLVNCEIADYRDKDAVLASLTDDANLGPIDAVFHEGACSDTSEWNGRYMLENNYRYSRLLLEYCLARGIPFIYASSAAVYGNGSVFNVDRQYEKPLNVYAYSKFLFDQYVRRRLTTATSQITGLRYFNVYGPHESHKGKMASVARQFNDQILNNGKARLFEGSDGYTDGEQRRDFIHVDDVCAVNLWFFEHSRESGIFNLGTGRSRTFNDVARSVIDWHGRGEIDYIAFPGHLRGTYQHSTEADIDDLRSAGYTETFMPLETGVRAYLDWLNR